MRCYYYIQMWGGAQFEDKANQLMNRLGSITKLHKSKPKDDDQSTTPSVSQLKQIQQELMASDNMNQSQLLTLNQNINQLSSTIKSQNQNRHKIDETFNLTLSKLQKNIKSILNSMGKAFIDRQNKLHLKIEALIKAEKKELDDQYTEIDQHLQNISKLQKKVITIIQQVNCLKRSRIEFEEKISRQFSQQIRSLKKMLQTDMKCRQQKEVRQLCMLKGLYKQSMEGIMIESRQRQQNERMLIIVVQQLVNQIIQI